MEIDSSPDPLTASNAPSVLRRSQPPTKQRAPPPTKRRSASPSKSKSVSAVRIHSPTEMTATSNSVLSPWRIGAMVRADRDDDAEPTPTGRGAMREPPGFTLGFGSSNGYDGDKELGMELPVLESKRGRSTSVGPRTWTTKVPLKGLSSPPERLEAEKPVAKMRRKGTPAKLGTKSESRPGASSSAAIKSSTGKVRKTTTRPKPAATPRRRGTLAAKTQAKAKPSEVGGGDGKGPLAVSDKTEEMTIETPHPSHTATGTAAKATRITGTRTASTPVPTLASTRSRRSSLAPPSLAVGTISRPKRVRTSSATRATTTTPRQALSGRDPNSNMSLSPGKSNFNISSRSSRRSSRRVPMPPKDEEIYDTIIVSQPNSQRKKGANSFSLGEGRSMNLSDFQPPLPPSLDTSMDILAEKDDEDISEEEALAGIPSASAWQAPATSEPDLDFTYISAGETYTPRRKKHKTSQGSPLFEDEPIGIESFYGKGGYDGERGDGSEDEEMDMPSILPEDLTGSAEEEFTYVSNLLSSAKPKDKGKGKAVERPEGDITPEKSRNHSTPGPLKGQSFYPSSPPLQVVIHTPAKAGSISTPSKKRAPDAELPEAPASRRRTNRETPSLTRVHEVSEIMSDALDVDEPMVMARQNFGNGFQGPPTPDSQMNREMEHDRTIPQAVAQSEPNPPFGDHSDIPSPSSSQPLEALTAASAPGPIISRGTSNRAVTPVPAAQTLQEATMSWAPTGRNRTPHRSVHFEDETSREARQRAFDRTAMLEDEWAKDREEDIRRAQEVGAITIEGDTHPSRESTPAVRDCTKALLEEWERERAQVRQQANEAGAISIDDTDDEEMSESAPRNSMTAPEDTPVIHIESSDAGPRPPAARPKISEANPMPRGVATRSITFNGSSNPPGLQRQTPLAGSLLTTTSSVSSSSAAAATANTRRQNTLSDSMLNSVTMAAPSLSGLVWKREDYKHLDAILQSRSTDPNKATTRYKVQLIHPERLLPREVIDGFHLDAEGYMRLSRKESAAVERFLRREKVKGRDWGLIEAVRRVAGMKIAGKRREWVRNG